VCNLVSRNVGADLLAFTHQQSHTLANGHVAVWKHNGFGFLAYAVALVAVFPYDRARGVLGKVGHVIRHVKLKTFTAVQDFVNHLK